MTREAFMVALPLTSGWGMETGMTIDPPVVGFTVQEAICDLKYRASGNNFAGQLYQADQYKGVARAVLTQYLRRIYVPHGKRSSASKLYKSYNAYKG